MEHHDDWTEGDDELENETRTWTGITEFSNRNEDRNASEEVQEAIPDDPETESAKNDRRIIRNSQIDWIIFNLILVFSPKATDRMQF